ncbi:hypothetical protein FOA52_000614 [Chlamydomonas sp. UWO 241]|nr:hypothetical protein FOA52_000614 [Chlamydomonas sp. UWO 241]
MASPVDTPHIPAFNINDAMDELMQELADGEWTGGEASSSAMSFNFQQDCRDLLAVPFDVDNLTHTLACMQQRQQAATTAPCKSAAHSTGSAAYSCGGATPQRTGSHRGSHNGWSGTPLFQHSVAANPSSRPPLGASRSIVRPQPNSAWRANRPSLKRVTSPVRLKAFEIVKAGGSGPTISELNDNIARMARGAGMC